MDIRLVRDEDAEAILAIYAPIVEQTFISFEQTPPSPAEMRRRIRALDGRLPWLVALHGTDLAGYAYAGPHRQRAAYQWSVEVSVYVAAGARGRGVATTLYRALFERLRAQGYVNAYAGIALPNAASVRLHEALGFELVGVYRHVGYKLGAWRDVGWWSLRLCQPPPTPAPPAPL